MSEVLRVGGTENPNRLGDVVFVHGLNGDPRSTWTSPGDAFWPDWIATEWPLLGIWSVGYEAAASGWLGSAMPLVDCATHVLDLLDAFELGEKPICFITHSMGGLLVKQMLRHAETLGPTYHRIVESTRGVVFLSTPHSGSRLADFIGYLSLLANRTAATKDLEYGEAHLRELNIWYRNNIHRLRLDSLIFYETLPTRGVVVVDAVSADAGLDGVIPVPIDADHLAVAKPASKTAQVYLQVNRFLRRLFIEPDRRRVNITIDLEFEGFGAAQENLLRFGLARFLDISPDKIQVKAKQRGSVVLTVEVPADAAERLVAAYRAGDERLLEALKPLPVQTIAIEPIRKPEGALRKAEGVEKPLSGHSEGAEAVSPQQRIPPLPFGVAEWQHHLFLTYLPHIDWVSQQLCRRYHCSAEETEEFVATIRTKLIDDDAVLRKFSGGGRFDTYLTAVIGRYFAKWRHDLWGKWRPSVEAKRLGPAAVKLEELTRDGYTFEESCAVLRTNYGVVLSRVELAELMARLPVRLPRKMEGEEQLEVVPGTEPAPDAVVLEHERQESRQRVWNAVARALAALPTEDRLLLKLRFESSLDLGEIAYALHLAEKPLYRRLQRLLRTLRKAVEQQGIQSEEVIDVLQGAKSNLNEPRRRNSLGSSAAEFGQAHGGDD